MGSDRPPTQKGVEERNLLTRSRFLRGNSDKIPLNSFLMRKEYLFESGIAEVKNTNDPAAQLENFDVSNMSEMLKKNMAMMVSQFTLMTWVNYFFSGFVLGYFHIFHNLCSNVFKYIQKSQITIFTYK